MKTKFKIALISFLVIFSIIYFFNHKHRARRKNYSDFACFYTAGKRMLAGEDIYVSHDKQAAEFRYAPVFALLMSVLALTDIDTADTVWFIINYALLVLSLVLLKKMVIPKGSIGPKAGALFWFLLALSTLRFIFPNFDNGQSNILMLSTAVGGLYLISKGREAAGGMVFALSAMIKYTPIIFIPYLFFRKKIKAALSATFGIIFYLFLPALFIGVKANFYYLRKLLPFLTQSTILEPGTILDPKNQSLFSAIKRQFSYCISDYHAPHMLFENSALSDIHIKMIFIFFAALIYAFILIRPRLNRDSILYYNLDYAMLLVCACLFNMNAWMLSYLLLIMPYFIIVYYAVKASFKDTAVTALLLLSYLLNIITIKGLAGEAFAYKALFYSPFTLMALVLFLALLKIKFFGKIDKHGYI